MFQKPLSDMTASINDLGMSGDFFYRHEPEAMARRFADWQKHAAIGDVSSVAAQWFRKSPKHMQTTLSVGQRGGELKNTPLGGNALAGAW